MARRSLYVPFYLVCLTVVFVITAVARSGRAENPLSNFLDSGQALGGSVESSDVALGDVDGDGDLDALVASYGASSRVYINQGGDQGGAPGVFQDSGQGLSASLAVDAGLDDLDGDGDLDAFLVRDSFGDSNEVWLNQGIASGIFTITNQTFGDSLSTSVALADLDGANGPDAFIGRGFGQPSKVWLNDGSGAFSDSGQSLDTDSSDVALGDLDGDGDPDAFSANGAANKVWVNQGGAQAGTPGVFLDSGQSLGSTLSLSVALGDVDGDGDLDAWVGNNASDRIAVNQGGMQGGTEGVFQEDAFISSGQTRDVALADLDGDGDLDAFLAKSGGNEVWINQGSDQGGTEGAFADSLQSLGDSFSEGLDLGDVDGDDDLDAFVANWPDPDKIYLNQAASPNPFAQGWQNSTVATRGLAGLYGDIALDASGRPHVIYVEHREVVSGFDDQLWYAYWDGVRWQRDLVATAQKMGDQGGYFALALAPNGFPMIAYASGTAISDQTLHYATWDGAQWQISDTGAPADHGQVAMALDSTGQPHIVSLDSMENKLLYTFWNGSAWQTDLIADINTPNDANPSLAMDAAGQPHVSFADRLAGEMLYATDDGQGWGTMVVNNVNDNPFEPYSDIQIAPGGNPAIAYNWGFFSDEIHYAEYDGQNWVDDLALDLGFDESFWQVSLDFDSGGDPHITFAAQVSSTNTFNHLRRDGGGWQTEILDNNGSVGPYNALAIDSQDRLHAIYYHENYGDLRYVTWAPDWQTAALSSGVVGSPAVQIDDSIPSIGYYNVSAGLLQLAEWTDAWDTHTAGFFGDVQGLSQAAGQNGNHIAFYDANSARLLYARWNGFAWAVQPLDESADVGRYNDIALVGGSDALVRVAYWDATFNRVKAAALGGVSPSPTTYANNAGPALDPDSGYTHITVLPDALLGISYYDGVADDLRFATLDTATGMWTDELVDGPGDLGRHNDIATDGTDGFPVIAYYDATVDAILLAHRDASWQFQTAVANAGGVQDLALDLGLGSRNRARIAYVTGSGEIRLAALKNGSWTVETVHIGTGQLGQVSLDLDDRAHMAFDDGGSLFYAFRTATLDVDISLPGGLPYPSEGYYNPLDACQAVLGLFTGTRRPTAGFWTPDNHVSPQGDQAVFRSMAGIFANTSGGQTYIGLYGQHGQEMGQLGLADPALMWDASGTLQNFLPGLEAFVSGRGAEVLVTQEMVDDALDIWQRLAAAGSPALANTINTELAKYNNLQDFVGMSFDEWALAIGVQPPETVFLPIVIRD